MATIRQKKLAKLIVENATAEKPLNGGELLEKVGYSPNLQKQPGRVIESEGVKEALEDYGFTEENAMKVVAEIMLNPDVDPNARIRASQEVFKVQGSYAPTKSIVANVDVDDGHKSKAKGIIEGFIGPS